MTVQGPNPRLPPELVAGQISVNQKLVKFQEVKEKLSVGFIKRMFEGIGKAIDAKKIDSKLQKLSNLEQVRTVTQSPAEAAYVDEQIASVRTSLNRLANKRIENAIPLLLHDCNRALSNININRLSPLEMDQVKKQLAKVSGNLITLSNQVQGTPFGKSENMDILKATLEMVQRKLIELNKKPIESETRSSPWRTDSDARKARLDALLEKGKAERSQQAEAQPTSQSVGSGNIYDDLMKVDANTSLHNLDDDLADLLKEFNEFIDKTQKDIDDRKNKPAP